MSDADDPFASPLDRTVIIPTPGGAASAPKASTPPPRSAAPPASAGSRQLGDGFDPHAADDPLVRAAAPLLLSAAQIRQTVSASDPAALRKRIVDEVRAFDAFAKAAGVQSAAAQAARYMLCTMIDEAAMGTPWGPEHGWADRTLLAEFHGETWGGEKVFDIIERAKREPGVNSGFLQLAYYVLAFGFEGKYRVKESGHLLNLKDGLFRILQNQRPAPERALSPQWRGREAGAAEQLMKVIPLWAVLAGTVGALVLIYAAYSLLLFNAARPAAALAQDIGGGAAAALADAPPPPIAIDPRQALAPHLGRTLEVVDEGPITTIRLLGKSPDGVLFRTGGADIGAAYGQALVDIADLLSEFPGAVIVEGHTDSTGSASANARTSQARAEAVAKRLAADGVSAARLEAEGWSSRRPLVAESSAADRALNRRVEIRFRGAGGGA